MTPEHILVVVHHHGDMEVSRHESREDAEGAFMVTFCDAFSRFSDDAGADFPDDYDVPEICGFINMTGQRFAWTIDSPPEPDSRHGTAPHQTVETLEVNMRWALSGALGALIQIDRFTYRHRYDRMTIDASTRNLLSIRAEVTD